MRSQDKRNADLRVGGRRLWAWAKSGACSQSGGQGATVSSAREQARMGPFFRALPGPSCSLNLGAFTDLRQHLHGASRGSWHPGGRPLDLRALCASRGPHEGLAAGGRALSFPFQGFPGGAARWRSACPVAELSLGPVSPPGEKRTRRPRVPAPLKEPEAGASSLGQPVQPFPSLVSHGTGSFVCPSNPAS